jgi:hypothetical protein
VVSVVHIHIQFNVNQTPPKIEQKPRPVDGHALRRVHSDRTCNNIGDYIEVHWTDPSAPSQDVFGFGVFEEHRGAYLCYDDVHHIGRIACGVSESSHTRIDLDL